MQQASTLLIIAIACSVAFGIFAIVLGLKEQKRKHEAGAEEMVGKVATAQTVINPTGKVLAEGELWTAISEENRIKPGEEVIITKVQGLKLRVKKQEKEDK